MEYAQLSATGFGRNSTLGDIVPGKYVLMAIDDGWDLDPKDSSLLEPYRKKGKVIQVTAGPNQKVTVNVLRRIDAKKPAN